jgi:hypothetical protein
MITKEQMQAAVGPLWDVDEVSGRSFEISMANVPPEERERLLIQIEKVREVAYSHQEREGCPLTDSMWHAAKVLLGPSKYEGLSTLYAGDAADTLTDISIAMALLGTAEAVEERVSFTASEALTLGIEELTALCIADARARMESEPDCAPPGEEGLLWLVSRELGWTELLPQSFELRKLGAWESDKEFITRCVSTLTRLAALFPPAESTQP